jgi:hypothetical protein
MLESLFAKILKSYKIKMLLNSLILIFQISYAEFIKLKIPKILLPISVVALLPCLYTTILLTLGPISAMYSWDEIMFGSGQFFNMLSPVLFILLTGHIFTSEYKKNMAGVQSSFMYSKLKIMLGKLITSSFLIIVAYYISLAIKLWWGMFLSSNPLTKEILIIEIKTCIFMIIANIALLPFTAAVSLLLKRKLVVYAYGISIFILMLMSIPFEFNMYFPWTAPGFIAYKMSYTNCSSGLISLDTSLLPAYIVLLLIFLLSMAFNCICIKTHKIHVFGGKGYAHKID